MRVEHLLLVAGAVGQGGLNQESSQVPPRQALRSDHWVFFLHRGLPALGSEKTTEGGQSNTLVLLNNKVDKAGEDRGEHPD